MKIPPGLSLGKVIGAKGASFKPLSVITECSVKVLPEERAVSCLQFNYNCKHDSTIYYHMHACVFTGNDCNNRQG